MIDITLFPAFLAAIFLLCIMPGPNWAMIASNSIGYGPRYGLLTVATTTVFNAAQLMLVTFGLAALLTAAGEALWWIRWAGAAYLVVLGVQTWRAAPLAKTGEAAGEAASSRKPGLGRRIVARAAVVALTNPKTLLFFAAFFPQFISADLPFAPQMAVLTATFVVVNVTVDCLFALAASRARGALAAHGRLLNRVTGGLLMGAGLGIGLVRRA